MDNDIKLDVIKSLEKEGYYWRAVDSIASELDISEDAVKAVLKDLINDHQLVVAPRKDAQSRTLFTTRKHYRETRGFLVRLISAITNRIV